MKPPAAKGLRPLESRNNLKSKILLGKRKTFGNDLDFFVDDGKQCVKGVATQNAVIRRHEKTGKGPG